MLPQMMRTMASILQKVNMFCTVIASFTLSQFTSVTITKIKKTFIENRFLRRIQQS